MGIPDIAFFAKYDINTDKVTKSKRMAIIESIANFNCFPLKETVKEVDTSELDDEGRYPKNAS